MNLKRALVTGLAIVFVGCAPEKDVFRDWTGAYVAVDDRGPLGRGCVLEENDGGRQLMEWRYAADGSIRKTSFEIESFELLDQYSENYGTRHPTWIYRYSTAESSGGSAENAGGSAAGADTRPDSATAGDAYPRFLIYEYFNGAMEARVKDGPDSPAILLRSVADIPPVLRLPGDELPEDLDDVRRLIGRHFWIESTVLAAERMERTGYAGTTASDLWGHGFIDHAELRPVAAGPWTVHAILQTPMLPPAMARSLELPHVGQSVEQLVRLVEVRQMPGTSERGVVLTLQYGVETVP